LSRLNDYNNAEEKIIQDFSRKALLPIYNRYNDLESMDTLMAAHGKISQIREVMSDSITRALDNKDTLTLMDKKSENLNSLAAGFYKGSSELYNRERARNRRLMIYGIVAAIVTVSIYFMTRSSSTTASSS